MSRQLASTPISPRRELFTDPVVLWRDVFAVFDDGSYKVEDYSVLEQRLIEQQKNFALGLGCLVVIPPGAQRIQDDVRAEIERVINTISVRCLCWAVLEHGFRGATIRGALTTINLMSRRKFPTHIIGGLEPAVSWMLQQLDPTNTRTSDKREAVDLLHKRAYAAR